MRRSDELFGEALNDRFVSLVFGNGIFALRGVVVTVGHDFLGVREEKDGTIIHVPFASIVYAKLGVHAEV